MKREELSTDPLVEVWRLGPWESHVEPGHNDRAQIIVTDGSAKLFHDGFAGCAHTSAELRPGEPCRLTALEAGAVLVVVWTPLR